MIDKKDLLDRFDKIQDKLKDAVESAHADLMNAGRGQYKEASATYKEAVDELNDFLKSAKVQREAVKLWLTSNKTLCIAVAAASFVGFVIGWAMHWARF